MKLTINFAIKYLEFDIAVDYLEKFTKKEEFR